MGLDTLPRRVNKRGVVVQPLAGEPRGGVVDDERAQVEPRAAQDPAEARVREPRSEVTRQSQVLRLPHPGDLARGAPHAATAFQRQAVAHLPHVPQHERGEVLVRLERRKGLERHTLRALVGWCSVLWLLVSAAGELASEDLSQGIALCHLPVISSQLKLRCFLHSHRAKCSCSFGVVGSLSDRLEAEIELLAIVGFKTSPPLPTARAATPHAQVRREAQTR